MEAINHFEKNRPVHLAIRDVHFEQAMHLLASSRETEGKRSLDMQKYEQILFLLRNAREHGYYASQKNQRDRQFFEFITMMSGNVKAVLSMLNLKRAVANMDGFLEMGDHTSVALQAEEYEQRARGIVSCLLGTLDVANNAYKELKVTNQDSFNEEEKGRYKKAKKHYKSLLSKGVDLPAYRKRVGLF